MESTPVNHQRVTYDEAYRSVEAIPFPDHKIEDGAVLHGKTIVSVGGGTGADVAHLAKQNTVFVVDYSTSAAEVAKAFGIEHVTLDLSTKGFRLPFEDASVDVLILKDILEHLFEPSALMAEARRVLRTNGRVVISIPNHFNLWGRIRILFGGNLIWKGILHDHGESYSEWNYMHIRFFTWKGLKAFVDESGFRITKTFFDFGPFGHYFSLPMYLEHLRIKKGHTTLSFKADFFLKVMEPLSYMLDAFFPVSLRNRICQIRPSLLTSCFYVHLTRR